LHAAPVYPELNCREATRSGVSFAAWSLCSVPTASRIRAFALVLCALVAARTLPAQNLNLRAENVDVTSVSSVYSSLPDAPGFQTPTQTPTPTAPAAAAASKGLASLSGTVISASDAAIPRVTVSLLGGGTDAVRDSRADEQGRFIFPNLLPGTYHIVISAQDIQTYESPDITLVAGQQGELPPAKLAIAATQSSITVFAHPDSVAQAQVHLAEKQRVLGILPNFYTSYIWDAAPMSSKLKFQLAARTLYDPLAFLIAGGVAGVEQLHNTFPGYGRGPEGYAKRYGAAYGDTAIGRMVGSAILPSLLHQDPRYFYRGTGSVPSRTYYAVKSVFITRGDNGKREFNYSQVLGDFADSGFANFYRTNHDRSAGLTVRNTFIIFGTNAAGNVIREFLLHHMTPNLPSIDQGKAAITRVGP
jgi:hypothetical protein